MSTADNICANCGKEGSEIKNTCQKCKSVKYCNASCKKKHRHKHKKHCERRVAELHDEALFKQPPSQHEDCPICFMRLPCLELASVYMQCCGKLICCGCMHAVVGNTKNTDVPLCPFCRIPAPTSDEEIVKRFKKRVEIGDALAIRNLGCQYRNGQYGLPQNDDKALELWHRAGDIGCSQAYHNIGNAYLNGTGVEVDEKKAVHYWELAAMGGCMMARHNLGNNEWRLGNMVRALKHYMIAAKDGHSNSLQGIKLLYTEGHATKDDYTAALHAYQEYLNEIKSNQRDEAAAEDDEFEYY